ncbi:MAG: murein hydrolase activator EnvC family protein [Bacillota bacterium]
MAGLRRTITIAVALCLVVALTLPVLAADDLASKQAEYQKIQKEIQQLEQKINSANKAAKTVTSEINRLDKEISQAEQQLVYLENRLATTEAELKATEAELAKTEDNLAQREEMLKTRIRALYERGPVSYLEVLLDAHSFSDLINRVGLLKQVVRQDVAIVDTIKIEREEIVERQAYLESRRQEVEMLVNETSRSRNQLASRKADRTSYMQKLTSDSASYAAALAKLEQTEKELERLIREAQANSPGGAVGTGTYTWPAPGYKKINSPYGWRTLLGKRSFHAGVDIGSPMGAKIVAVDNGTVLYSGWLGDYGQVVIIDHGKNANGKSISTVYAHNSVLLVKTNDKVLKGQQISKAGSTGFSTGPHLHFEYRIDGAKVNPLDYVKP